MIFPHISKTFVSGGIIHLERGMPRREAIEEKLESLDINAIYEEGVGGENLSSISPTYLEVFWITGLRKRFLYFLELIQSNVQNTFIALGLGVIRIFCEIGLCSKMLFQ